MVNLVSISFPKGGHSATQTELINTMNTHKVKRRRNADTKNRQHAFDDHLVKFVRNNVGKFMHYAKIRID